MNKLPNIPNEVLIRCWELMGKPTNYIPESELTEKMIMEKGVELGWKLIPHKTLYILKNPANFSKDGDICFLKDMTGYTDRVEVLKRAICKLDRNITKKGVLVCMDKRKNKTGWVI